MVRTVAWTARQASFVRPSPVSTWLDSTFSPCFFRVLNSGQQSPVYRRFIADNAIRQLLGFNNTQPDLFRCILVRAGSGAFDRDTPKAHRKPCLVRAPLAGACRHLKTIAALRGLGIKPRIKFPARCQGAVAACAREQVGALIGQPRPFFVYVAFPVGDNGHHTRRSQAFFAGLGNFQPAVGFPLLYRQLPVVGRRFVRPDPMMEVRQSKAGAVCRINGQQRMPMETTIAAIWFY